MPRIRGIKFKLERDVDKVIGTHLDNFNRIFEDQGKTYRFEVEAHTPEIEKSNNFIGAPDHVLTLDSKVLSFVEYKTCNDLPVRHPVTGKVFDLLDMYHEDIQGKVKEDYVEDFERVDVLTLIEQVYGYLSLNNLIYGAVTCYDVTYFLYRPSRGTLLISYPIFNFSRSPTVLQALYYFVQLALEGQETLDPERTTSDLSIDDIQSRQIDTESTSEGNIDCTTAPDKSNFNVKKRKYSNRRRFKLDLDSYHSGTVIGSGATGQAIRLKGSNIVVKQCDSFNNPSGFKMLRKEISIYEKLSEHSIAHVPQYYGACDYYGQHFIAMEYIPGKNCDWRTSSELKKKFELILEDLKSVGIVHLDLKPENVLLTPDD